MDLHAYISILHPLQIGKQENIVNPLNFQAVISSRVRMNDWKLWKIRRILHKDDNADAT